MDAVRKLIDLEQEENARIQLVDVIQQNLAVSGKDLISATHAAAKKDYVSIIGLLHARWPTCIDLLDEDFNSTLHHASRNGSVGVVSTLVRLGTSSAMIANIHDYTPLTFARFSSRASRILETLYPLYSGDDVPLQFFMQEAIKSLSVGSCALIEFLQQKQPCIFETRTQNGNTLLTWSATFNARSDGAASEVLCKFTPSLIDARNDENKTAMHIAIRKYIPAGWNIFLAMHRHGSESHFVRDDNGKTPVDISRLIPRRFLKFSIRPCYFSRSLAEVLFFTLCADEIQPLRRIEK